VSIAENNRIENSRNPNEITDDQIPIYEELTEQKRAEMFYGNEFERELLFRAFEKRARLNNQEQSKDQAN
jgi:hypothetical protein